MCRCVGVDPRKIHDVGDLLLEHTGRFEKTSADGLGVLATALVLHHRFTARRLDMCRTCGYASSMTKMIQIRNVPDRVHATLKARAALAGQPLTDYLLAELRRVVELPTEGELVERLLRREQAKLRTSPAAAVRAERDTR
jgi:antitoxin FitA